MHAFLSSVRDGALWVADTLDDLLVEAALGFGAAAPIIADRAGEPVPENPGCPAPRAD
jgi:hypothetical protein